MRSVGRPPRSSVGSKAGLAQPATYRLRKNPCKAELARRSGQERVSRARLLLPLRIGPHAVRRRVSEVAWKTRRRRVCRMHPSAPLTRYLYGQTAGPNGPTFPNGGGLASPDARRVLANPSEPSLDARQATVEGRENWGGLPRLSLLRSLRCRPPRARGSGGRGRPYLVGSPERQGAIAVVPPQTTAVPEGSGGPTDRGFRWPCPRWSAPILSLASSGADTAAAPAGRRWSWPTARRHRKPGSEPAVQAGVRPRGWDFALGKWTRPCCTRSKPADPQGAAMTESRWHPPPFIGAGRRLGRRVPPHTDPTGKAKLPQEENRFRGPDRSSKAAVSSPHSCCGGAPR